MAITDTICEIRRYVRERPGRKNSWWFRRRVPLELARKELLVQLDHRAVARKQMVVVALEPDTGRDLERARLTRDIRPALDERHREPAPGQLPARDETGDAGSDDGDPSRHRT